MPSDPWGFLPTPAPAQKRDPWAFLPPPVVSAAGPDGWEPTGSPLVQKRRRPDGSYETRPTPQEGREPAVAAEPTPTAGERLDAMGNRIVTAAAEGIASMPDLLWSAYGAGLDRDAATAKARKEAVASGLPPSAAQPVDAPSVPLYPQIGEAGGFFDLKGGREDIHRQYEAAKDRFRSLPFPSPGAAATADTVGEALALAIPLGEGGKAAKGLEDIGGAADRALAPAVRDLAKYTPEELKLLARRAKVMPSIPGVEEPFLPRGVPEAIGAHADEASQLQALGMRTTKADGEELARLSSPNAYRGEPVDPWAFLPEPPKPPELPPIDVTSSEGPPELSGLNPQLAQDRKLAPMDLSSPAEFVSEGNLAKPPENIPGLFTPGEPPPLSPPLTGGEAPPKLLSVDDLLGPAEEGMPPVDTPPSARPIISHPAIDRPLSETAGGVGKPPDQHPPGLTTGTTHAITRAERVAAGLPEVERLAARESPSWAEAKALYTERPEAARDLAEHVRRNPRQLTDVENDVLLHDRMSLTLDYREALTAEEKALKGGDQTAAALATMRRQSIEAAHTANTEALDKAGTVWGRAGRARQKLATEDYSAITLNRRYAVANAGEEAPAAVRQRLTEISAKLDEAHVKLAAAEERAQQLEAARVVAHEAKQGARAGRAGGRAKTVAQLEAENRLLTQEFARKSSTPRAGLDPELAAILAKKAKNRIQAGVTDLQDLVDQLYTEAKPYLSELEPRDVRDVIAGSGPKAQAAAKKAAETDLARLRREARVLNAAEDVHARLADPGLSREARQALEAEAARWEEQAAQQGAGTGRGPMSTPERLAASKKRAGEKIADLEAQIASGEFKAGPGGRVRIQADSELLSARAEVERLRREADRIIAHRQAANRTPFQKVMDWTPGWGRFVKLSGVSTLQKLASAAGERALIFRPLEDLVGGGLSKLPVVKHFAREAPIEGGSSLSAIAKSYAEFFGKDARAEAGALLRGKEGPMDLAFGKSHENPGVPKWMEIPGKVHGALKAPAKVSGYYFAMEKQAQYYLGRGEGAQLLNPLVQAEMKARAWEYAQREIFMGDNALVQAFNDVLKTKPGQTKITTGVKAGARVMLPIVKVPTNYALELTDYAAGVPKSAARMAGVIKAGRKAAKETGAARDIANLVKLGLEQVGPKEAELIMRQMKKGTLGAGLIALGATGGVEGGGYYVPGEHRREGELQPGEIRIAGHAVPHMILHHPAIEALQVGSAIYREKKIADGLANAAWGAAEAVPFFEEPLRAGRTLRNDPSQFWGGIERGLTIPPDIQRLARLLDQRGDHSGAEMLLQQLGWQHIDGNKRKATGGFFEQLGEEEMLGIPYARQKVR